MKNLLVPTDFSAESHHAYAVALQVAQATGGRVTLLHVLEAPDAYSANFSTYGGPVNGSELPNSEGGLDQLFTIKLMQVTRQRMHALKAEGQQLAANVPVADAVEFGRIGDGILQAVAHHNIDLIVMGAQGHGAVEHAFGGSNTERMIRLAPCPVLTVKQAPAGAFAVRSIVFASDFTAEAAAAAAGLQQVQAAFPQATLHLLHVLSGQDMPAARQHIRAFAEQAGLHNAVGEIVEAASPAAGIERYAQQIGADLVVLPTHGRTGLSGFFQTSIAETVATHALPPVLTYHLATPS